ncbi:MAG: ABC transporter permease [Clostridiales bacterium]|jgi:peptide/nickel transport system permease protein|nr:ABC transporter permease [Clostridiales bacterium]
MKNTLRQITQSPKFMIGFCLILVLILTTLIYPLFSPGSPLEMIGLGTFFRPGTYVSVYDSVTTDKRYTINLTDAAEKRVASKLASEDKEVMKTWLLEFGIAEEEIDLEDTEALLDLWFNTYDESIRFDNMTTAVRKHVQRTDAKLDGLLEHQDIIVADSAADGSLVEGSLIKGNEYINVAEIANVRVLPLGTDNFGRDMLKEMISALGVSLMIGLIAGAIATFIGLALGLLSGYLGGVVDDIIMFVTNLFTVIPSFVLLILISFSIGQSDRGATTVAIVIGLTSWVWTTRSVRAQVTSLRNRDHVNLSKLSGHSLIRILVTDILPYIASYVIMAFILQICSGILAEAQLSMLGLGPKTTSVPTLGLMMFWAMAYTAHLNGAWWAYFPLVILIACISFSLNLMNTGLDQVFNPQLRD